MRFLNGSRDLIRVTNNSPCLVHYRLQCSVPTRRHTYHWVKHHIDSCLVSLCYLVSAFRTPYSRHMRTIHRPASIRIGSPYCGLDSTHDSRYPSWSTTIVSMEVIQVTSEVTSRVIGTTSHMSAFGISALLQLCCIILRGNNDVLIRVSNDRSIPLSSTKRLTVSSRTQLILLEPTVIIQGKGHAITISTTFTNLTLHYLAHSSFLICTYQIQCRKRSQGIY